MVKIRKIPTTVRNKTRKPIITVIIQHYSGRFKTCNIMTKRRKYKHLIGRDKIVTFCKNLMFYF